MDFRLVRASKNVVGVSGGRVQSEEKISGELIF
jgi:hypothetical protein